MIDYHIDKLYIYLQTHFIEYKLINFKIEVVIRYTGWYTKWKSHAYTYYLHYLSTS